MSVKTPDPARIDVDELLRVARELKALPKQHIECSPKVLDFLRDVLGNLKSSLPSRFASVPIYVVHHKGDNYLEVIDEPNE